MSSQNSQPFHWHYGEFDDRNSQIHGRTLFFMMVLLSIMFVMTIVFLYARWVCRYHSLSFPISSPASLPPPLTQPRGINPAIIEGLPIILHQTSNSDTNPANSNQEECCICLGLFEDGEKVKVLPQCSHCYHPQCIDKWLCSHSSCPICRVSIQVPAFSDCNTLRIEIAS